MQRRIFHFLVGLFLLASFCLGAGVRAQGTEDGQVLANKIASFSNKAIYNLDTDQLRAVVESYLNEHAEIRALVITETIDNERLLTYFRKDGEAVFDQPIPDDVLSFKSFTAISKFEGEDIGSIKIYYGAVSALGLTAEEQAWIRGHRVVRTLALSDWAPFDYRGEDGSHKGITADILRLVAARAGFTVKPEFGQWSVLLDKLKNKELDLAPDIYHTKSREAFVVYTKPYFELLDALYVQSNNKATNGLGDLKGLTIAIEEGFSFQEELTNKYPDIKQHVVANTIEALKAVSSGKADAYVGNQYVTSHLIKKHILPNLKFVDFVGEPISIYMATRKDWPLFRGILDKALASIGEEEKSAIINKYIGPTDVMKPAEEPVDMLALVTQFGGGAIALLILVMAFTVIIRILDNRDKSRLYESRELKGLSLLLIGVFLVVVVLSAWYTMQSAGQQARRDVGGSLQTVLQSTHETLKVWIDAKSKDLRTVTEAFGTRTLIRNLLRVTRDREELSKSRDLMWVRDLFQNEEDRLGNLGFFVITRNGISVGSSRDANLATQNIIYKHHKDRLDKVFKGETVFIPPMASDVPLETGSGGVQKQSVSMFLVTPVRDTTGKKVVAAFATRLDPLADYSRIIQLGRIGNSGETYAFNRNGRLISASRFEEDFRLIGILGEKERSILNIQLRDPGGNLLEGHTIPDNFGDRPLTLMAAEATAGRPGRNVEGYTDYRGVPVMGAWLWDKQLGIGLATEIDQAEGLSSFVTTRNTVLAVLSITVLVSLFLVGLSIWIGRSANRSLRKARDDLELKVEERTQELKVAEEHTRRILESAGEGVFGLNAQGITTFVNPSACRMTGFSPEELIGKPMHTLIHHTYADGTPYPLEKCHMRAAFTEGEVRHVTDEVLWRKDSTNFPVEYTSTPIEKEGELLGAVVTFSDITERKQAEEKLSEAFEETRKTLGDLNAVMEAIDYGVVFVDAGLRARVINKAFVDIWGVDRNMIAKRPILADLIYFNRYNNIYPVADEDFDDFVKSRVEMVKAGNIAPVEMNRLDGRVLVYQCNELPNGGRILTYYDITDRKEAEQQLAEKEAQLSLALDNMSDGMFLMGKDENYILINDRYKELTGLPPELLSVGKSVRGVVEYLVGLKGFPTIESERAVDERMDQLSSSEPGRMEMHVPDGPILELRNAPASDVGTVVVATDLTERIQQEAKLSDAFDIISGSIDYASRIQRAVLPDDTLFSSLLADHMVMWEPRDVVGGDIYWCRLWGDGFLMILGDCTGHGVPGAFMTLIATGALDNALSEVPPGHVADLMQRIHQLVQVTLGQHGEGSESDDGMELGMCYLGAEMDEVTFVGARFELYLVEDGQVSIVKGTRSGIGYQGISHTQEYEEHQIVNLENKTFFMSSDGLIDQVGGEKRRMYGKRRFKELLLSLKDQPMSEHKKHIYRALIDYQGDENRRDDVSVLGFRV